LRGWTGVGSWAAWPQGTEGVRQISCSSPQRHMLLPMSVGNGGGIAEGFLNLCASVVQPHLGMGWIFLGRHAESDKRAKRSFTRQWSASAAHAQNRAQPTPVLPCIARTTWLCCWHRRLSSSGRRWRRRGPPLPPVLTTPVSPLRWQPPSRPSGPASPRPAITLTTVRDK
jgi:hypothetical protein